MTSKKCTHKFLFISTIACIVISIQVLIISIRGHEACLNTGCKVISSLTNIPSLLFNIFALAYFLVITGLGILDLKGKKTAGSILEGMLICSAAAEGILLGFQIFVAKHYCSYCLLIFCIVIILIAIRSRKLLLESISIILAELLVISVLNFSAAFTKQIKLGLSQGSYGKLIVKKHYKQPKMFLIFSLKCPHCIKIIKELHHNQKFSIYLNPVEIISNKPHRFLSSLHIKRFARYNPSVNIAFLKLTGTKIIPLLIVKKQNTFILLRGDSQISSYLHGHSSINTKSVKPIQTSPSASYERDQGCLFGKSCSENSQGHQIIPGVF